MENNLKSLLAVKPKAVKLPTEYVRTTPLANDARYPVLLEPKVDDINVIEWIKGNKDYLEAQLSTYGALLFRNFNIGSIDLLQKVAQVFSDQPMKYTHRSTPRTELASNVYTSTNHPAEHPINMHNELCYALNWPLKIMFYCVTPAAVGGETPIADSRKVYNYLSEATRERFARKGVAYVRNLSGDLGLPWQEVFQTRDKRRVEEECRENHISYEWKSDTHLILRWVRPAIAEHPVTREKVWFNHAYFFNSLALDKIVLNTLSPSELPFNTFYGDGTAITAETIQEISTAFEKAKSVFAWRKDDLLLLDNMLMAHGRNPFRGERKIAVTMCQPMYNLN
jgi:hypothetical protein